MPEKIYLENELDKFMSKIRNGENFTLMRFGDGERAIMRNIAVRAQEGWQSPGHNTSLGNALKEALALQGENVYHGISCPCCDRGAYYWYISRIEHKKNVTFANIFVNRNYRTFLSEFQSMQRDAIVIANHKWGGGA